MKSYHRIISAFIIAFTAAICPMFAADSEDSLYRDLNVIFTDQRLSDAQWGVAVYSLDRDELLFGYNSNKLSIPASNEKILTAAAALLRLGPEYRFKTRVLSDGAIGAVEDGTLRGNLIIQGFGDPSFSTRMGNKDPFSALHLFAVRLKALGIKSITGNIAGDASAFKGTGYGRGWELDDLTESFAAPVSALAFNENYVSFQIKPGAKAGDAAILSSEPLPGYPLVDNSVVTTVAGKAASIVIDHVPGDSGAPETIRIRGNVPLKSQPIRQSVAIKRPVRYYLEALRRQLEEENINVSNCGVIEEYSAPGSGDSGALELILAHESAPLAELLSPIMKDSLNMPSETLLRVLGLEFRGVGTDAAGIEVVAETLETMGIRKGSYIYADASGLSRRNLISPDVFVRALAFMYRQPFFPRFYDAMAIAGTDGTLKNRLAGATVKGNIHAKTGTITGVTAISGYMRTADGEMLAFSMIANNYASGKAAAEDVQNRALQRLARFSRKN